MINGFSSIPVTFLSITSSQELNIPSVVVCYDFKKHIKAFHMLVTLYKDVLKTRYKFIKCMYYSEIF